MEHVPRPTGTFSSAFALPTTSCAALSSCLKEKSLRDMLTPPSVQNRLCALIVRKKIRRVLTPRVNRRKIFCVLFLIAEPNVLAVAADLAAVGRRLMLTRHVSFHSALRTFPIRKISRRQTCHGENYCRDNRRRRQKFFHDLTSASWHNPWRMQDPP